MVRITCVESESAFAFVPVMMTVWFPAGVAPDVVVTCKPALCELMPALSLAATVKAYVVEGDKPVAVKVIVPLVPIFEPFS